jgi:hypothetical protein
VARPKISRWTFWLRFSSVKIVQYLGFIFSFFVTYHDSQILLPLAEKREHQIISSRLNPGAGMQ